jgi:hypothetical protein
MVNEGEVDEVLHYISCVVTMCRLSQIKKYTCDACYSVCQMQEDLSTALQHEVKAVYPQ